MRAPDGIEERVLVAGGGPTGLALAVTLARQGVASLVLERRTEPTPRDESRAITWMPTGLDVLDRLGLAERFHARGVLRRAHEFRSETRRLLTLRFDALRVSHPYTLQLPQHESEHLLEEAALETGLVEVRRRHGVVEAGGAGGAADAEVAGPEISYRVSARLAVACDGAGSLIRRRLGIEESWRDYGAYSAVADFHLDCDLPTEVSRVVFDRERPHGFFYFAPGRWRMIYRLNAGEDRDELTREERVRELLASYLPNAVVHRFLWASAFRLGQGHASRFRRGPWLLAGDAAHAMGPSAGAGMMLGVIGGYRLGLLLARALHEPRRSDELLERYELEQRQAALHVQRANARVFRQLAVRSRAVIQGWNVLLGLVGRVPRVALEITKTESLARLALPEDAAVDERRTAWLSTTSRP